MKLDTVQLGRLKNIVDRLEKDGINLSEEISFEFLMANCFPSIYDNIKAEMTKRYIEGFERGLEKGKERRDKNENTWNN